MQFIIPSALAGRRLDHFLAENKSFGMSRAQIQRLIGEGHITVNQKQVKPSVKLKTADCITVSVPAPKPLTLTPEATPLAIMYEDDDLIVINKARGMTVHPGAGRNAGTLVNALLHHCKDLSGIGGVLRPGIVHRLDKDTTGLLVVAKNDFTHQALSKQFKERTVSKQYVALLHGAMKNSAGTVELRIGRHPVQRRKMAVVGRGTKDEGCGREAVTLYKVMERFEHYTLVELTLKTGRTHQIRVHMSHLGHPVVGDQTYGRKKEAFKVNGQLLHSAKLGFTHPRTGKRLEFAAPLPEDMQTVIMQLRKK